MSITKKTHFILLLLALGPMLMFSGCANQRAHYSTSVVDYLYSSGDDMATKASTNVPTLTLPLNVGIAFVPGLKTERSTAPTSVPFMAATKSAMSLTERQQMDLMREVASHFKKYPFIRNIELIPSTYLTARGGFANLDQLRGMYGIDVIALLSYDQVQFTDDGLLSLTYVTVVGAFVVPGDKNDTHTMLDAVVYDIKSRKMLFRAPGTSQIKGSATLANLGEQLRIDSGEGFTQASKQMIQNLDEQLANFRDKVKEQPKEFKIIRPAGYTASTENK